MAIRFLLLCHGCLVVFLIFYGGYVGFPVASTTPSMVTRASYESGKVDAGLEIGGPSAQALPDFEIDDETAAAILICLDGGCSVETLLALDEIVARDEQRLVTAMEQITEAQQTGFSEESAQHFMWYEDLLRRLGALRAQFRAQLVAFQGKQDEHDSDYVKQSRPNDYPKVGASPYSF